ncbi:protein THEM6 [Procambarus clarkii]|uniref:protein THEM6 n=1 Tax=Procambarus clarkii TaxID=6728 RepID=UPI001E671E21|nr:protein THEM6-like [Procambarus clarkii]XP_045610982.1 protein THEM6-like [Procambarus clarkii]XP_045610983.1 protein THEM6-like [Procambarus clarkii]XP_045610984.1 protein THEM6-like [Procambarus clarkii]
MVELSTVAIGLFLSLEVGYFLKAAIYGITSKFFLSRINALSPSTLYGICTTRDIDFMLNHINNARYLRAMDFGRVDHCLRAGIYQAVAMQKAKLLVAASTIRYRKPVYLFMPYRLHSQLVYWDDRNLYYRQDFETIHDNFLRTTAYVKLAVVGSKAEEILLSALPEGLERPEAPEDLLSWIQYNQQSSHSLKKHQ